MQYPSNGVYAKPTQVVPTYYNPNIPVDSRQLPVPPQHTPGALIPQPPMKPPQTVYERTIGMRIRYAILAGFLFFLFSMPSAYRVSTQIWGLFSSIPLMGRTMLVPTMVQHPNGYQVQQMVEKPCGISFRAMLLHAGLVTAIMYLFLSKNS